MFIKRLKTCAIVTVSVVYFIHLKHKITDDSSEMIKVIKYFFLGGRGGTHGIFSISFAAKWQSQGWKHLAGAALGKTCCNRLGPNRPVGGAAHPNALQSPLRNNIKSRWSWNRRRGIKFSCLCFLTRFFFLLNSSGVRNDFHHWHVTFHLWIDVW